MRSLLPHLLNIIALFFVAYVLFVLLLYFFQDKLIFFPQRITHERWEQVAEEVEGEAVSLTTADGVTLKGWFLRGSGTAPRKTIIFFGGNAMRLDYFAYSLDYLRSAGINVVLVDYRGYGLSEGRPSTDAMQSDSEVIYDSLSARAEVDPDRIFVWGISIGAGVAVHLASVRDVAGLILFAPFTSTVDVAKEVYPYLPVKPLLRHKLDNISLAPLLSTPALIVHGDRDRIQGVSHARRLADAWGGEHELVILKGRGHNDLFAEEGIWERIIDFVGQ